nr:hypothetical protein [uncultured Rhodopila sp.]
MSVLAGRIEAWPSRDLRRLAYAAGLDPDAVASAVRARAGAPKPTDDRTSWDHAFRVLMEALKSGDPDLQFTEQENGQP